MLVVAAVGASALVQRGEPLTPDIVRARIKRVARSLAPVAASHKMVIGCGSGPQAALLAIQGAEYAQVETCPIDHIRAQAEMAIGYMIEQELGNLLTLGRSLATVLTMVEVDADDPAFSSPSQFTGPVYLREEADRLSAMRGWVFKPDGSTWRRVVPCPKPVRIVELCPIKWLLEHGTVVIAAGGGGIPSVRLKGRERAVATVDCLVDPDLASELLARELEADVFVMLTGADAVYAEWGTPSQKAIRRASPDALSGLSFASESMGMKVTAASRFAAATGKRAAIGPVTDFEKILAGEAGTTISVGEPAVTYAAPRQPMAGA